VAKSNKSSSLGVLFESFFGQRLVRQQQASPATIAAYKDTLRLLVLYASEKLEKQPDCLDIQDLGCEFVLGFLDHLESERGNSVRTRNTRLAVIHSFFRHVAFAEPTAIALAQRVLAISPKRTTHRVLGFLKPPETEALLSCPDRRTKIGRRDHGLLLFMLHTGARVSEAIGVNTTDLSLIEPRQVLIRGKGAKERIVPLAKDLATILSDLCDEQRLSLNACSPIFVDARGNRLTRFGVTHMLRRTVAKAAKRQPTMGQLRISPHTLRHTTAMRLLQSGVDLSVIRSWLGHVDIQTTHLYLEADVEMKRKALVRANVSHETRSRYQPQAAILALLEHRSDRNYVA